MTEQSQQIALYQGVNVEKAAYMAAFSQAGGLLFGFGAVDGGLFVTLRLLCF